MGGIGRMRGIRRIREIARGNRMEAIQGIQEFMYSDRGTYGACRVSRCMKSDGGLSSCILIDGYPIYPMYSNGGYIRHIGYLWIMYSDCIKS